MLCEYVRGRIARTICHRFADAAGQIHVITMDPAMEDRIAAGFELTDRGISIPMSPPAIEITCQQIAQQGEEADSGWSQTASDRQLNSPSGTTYYSSSPT